MSDDKILPFKGKDPVQEAVRNLSRDAGALYEPPVLAALREMRQQRPADFARLRIQVKETRMLAMQEFDRLTATDSSSPEDEAASRIFPVVSPWPEPVDGATLLDDVVQALERHVIADRETLRAAALWAAFTWLIDSVQVAPIAHITAPEKRCGKSVLLTALGKLVCRPLQVANIGPAALFRTIELWQPTLLIDEVDAFLAAHEDARGILNAGFTRDSALVLRCVGDDHMPTPFNVWGAKALCGIGRIADTLADRSIPLRLRRKRPGERAESLRHSDPGLWEGLRARLARFARDSAGAVSQHRPEPIQGLNDRANDCWEPLLAIAAQAGGHWPGQARLAAIALHGIEGDAPSIGVELLGDIRQIFDNRRTSKLFSSDLLNALLEDEEAPWATWNRGKPMTAKQLSVKLKDFGIKSTTVRAGLDVKKGYHLNQFTDAFSRYLSQESPPEIVTPLQPSSDAAYSDFQSVTLPPDVTDKKTLQTTVDAGCNDVTDSAPLPADGEDAEYF